MSALTDLKDMLDQRAADICPIQSRSDRRTKDARQAWIDGFTEGAWFMEQLNRALAKEEAA